MKSLLHKSLDQTIRDWWHNIDPASRTAFFFVTGISLLAFGFEMTNLTLHHDDVNQIFIQDDILGHYLGRFGVGRLHLYTQNAYFMPFLQMLEGIVFMSIYGILVARFWGARKTFDIILVAAILCVFPYMAQLYQYNTSMATYSLAHLLAATAVIVSVRGTALGVVLGAILYIAAFSIYQSVLANAATIFLIWALMQVLYPAEERHFFSRTMLRSTIGALLAAIVGGVIYIAIVSTMDLQFDSYQDAGEAFELGKGLNLSYAITEVIKGTRAFFMWPEAYFPNYLKKLQLLLVLGAGLYCLLLPKGIGSKITAIALLGLALFSPRILQILHPGGHYHALTLTAYALVFAGSLTIILRTGKVFVKNITALLSFIVIAAYVIQCNWISTVNYLNTLAHYTTLTQVLSRVRSVPGKQWDGEHIAVVGRYDMPSDYPFKPATGVANEFIHAHHMQKLAQLMREKVNFVEADESMPDILAYAKEHPLWPNPASVTVIDGMGVVVFAHEPEGN